MPYFKIRPECFRLPDTTPEYDVHRMRQPGGKMEFTIADHNNKKAYKLGDAFVEQMLQKFVTPNPELIIKYCIEQGIIPFPYEVYT